MNFDVRFLTLFLIFFVHSKFLLNYNNKIPSQRGPSNTYTACFGQNFAQMLKKRFTVFSELRVAFCPRIVCQESWSLLICCLFLFPKPAFASLVLPTLLYTFSALNSYQMNHLCAILFPYCDLTCFLCEVVGQ